MISQATIKKHKLDSDSLKKLFTAEKPSKLVKELVELVSDRQREGKIRCLNEYKTWAAVDLAYDAPLTNSQTSILRNILEQGANETQTLEALKKWGLNPELLFVEQDLGNGTRKWTPNYPALFSVTIPLVRAYLTIRLANIFNDRNVTPLFQYQPTKYNAENRVLCEILTSLVESITTDYGYPATLRKWIFNALMYAVSIKFPVEKWDVQKQEDSHGEDVVEKQGIRYIVPHISSIYWDLNYPLHTLNTGTGCSYAGYWTVMRWGEVANSKLYWNLDAVPHGTNWLDPSSAWHNYFVEVAPCTLDFPTRSASKETNREKMAANIYNNRSDYDKAFFIGYQFVELVPADWGLGTYKNKVWMKFTIGADDVIMFAETFGYRPIDYIGYDSDDGRGRNASLAQEIQPSQDMASNILCQYISTIKRNLTNIGFYNTQAVDSEMIREMRARSQAQYQALNLFGFDGLKMERAGVDMNNIFKMVTFTPANTSEILQSLNTVLSILERTLVMSAQEIASAASHQQGNKEIEIIQQSKSNRVAYTSASIDEGIDAWKRQIVEAAMCHMDTDEVEAQISLDIPNLDAELEKIGFERKDKNPPMVGQKSITVKGKLSKLKLTQFISRRADKDRKTDMGVSQAILTTVSAVANNQFLSGVVAPTDLVKLLELAAKMGGADDDFKIGINADAAVAQQVSKVAAEIQQQILAVVEKTVTQPAATAIAKTTQETEQNKTDIQNLLGVLEQLQQTMAAGSPLPAPSVSMKLPPPAGLPPAPLVPPIPPVNAAPVA